MSEETHPHVVHVDDLEWADIGNGAKFSAQGKRLGAPAGAEKLGCSLYAVEPGKCAFPYHAHAHNEEAIYVLEGEGTLRLGGTDGEKKVPVRAGHYVVLPGNLQVPHQLINTGTSTLKYLCFSTTVLPEVLTYPDSQKAGMMVDGDRAPQNWMVFRGRGFKLLKDAESLQYFDGE